MNIECKILNVKINPGFKRQHVLFIIQASFAVSFYNATAAFADKSYNLISFVGCR